MDTIQALAEQFGKNNDAVMAVQTKTAEKVNGVAQKIDEQATKVAVIEETLSVMQQKMVAGGRGGGLSAGRVTKSFGELIVGSEKFRDLKEHSRSGPKTARFDRVEFETKAFIATSPDFVEPARDGLVPMPRRRMTIRNLLSTRSIDSNTAQFLRATGRTNSAAPVAEGALKPQSSVALELVPVAAKVLAHWAEASLQLLDDAPEVAAYINSELLYGLELVEEAQLLFGDNVGENIQGIIPLATAYALPAGAVAHTTSIDLLSNAILQASLTDVVPDGVVLNPADWQRLRTIKDSDFGNVT